MPYLVLTGTREGANVVLGKCAFRGGVCNLAGLSDHDVLGRARYMEAVYGTRLEAGDYEKRKVNGDAVERRAPAPPAIKPAVDVGVASRTPTLSRDRDQRPRDASRH